VRPYTGVARAACPPGPLGPSVGSLRRVAAVDGQDVAGHEGGGVRAEEEGRADQLLHVCVHGARWDVVPPVRWIPDAVTIVNVATGSGEEIDWHHLTTQTRKLRLTLPLRDALAYLRDSWNVAVPPAVLRSLQETPVSRSERIEHAARIRPKTVPNVVLHHWAQNTRLAGDAGVVRRLVRFPAYLCGVWGLKTYWQVPLRATYAIVRHIRSKRR
jgi:hypothetical protein